MIALFASRADVVGTTLVGQAFRPEDVIRRGGRSTGLQSAQRTRIGSESVDVATAVSARSVAPSVADVKLLHFTVAELVDAAVFRRSALEFRTAVAFRSRDSGQVVESWTFRFGRTFFRHANPRPVGAAASFVEDVLFTNQRIAVDGRRTFRNRNAFADLAQASVQLLELEVLIGSADWCGDIGTFQQLIRRTEHGRTTFSFRRILNDLFLAQFTGFQDALLGAAQYTALSVACTRGAAIFRPRITCKSEY